MESSQKTARTSRSKKILLYIIIPPLIFAAAIVLVVFLYLHFHSPIELDVTTSGFARSTVEINEGETIHIVNQSHVVQVLCLGQDKTCDASALAPVALKSPGIRLPPGASVDVTFELYGTYNVTSTSAGGVNLEITVNAGG